MAFHVRLALSRILEGAEPRGFSLTLHILFCSFKTSIWERMILHSPLTSQGRVGVVLKRIVVTFELQDWLILQKLSFLEAAARTRIKNTLHVLLQIVLCWLFGLLDDFFSYEPFYYMTASLAGEPS